jgi:hypothetical protein
VAAPARNLENWQFFSSCAVPSLIKHCIYEILY